MNMIDVKTVAEQLKRVRLEIPTIERRLNELRGERQSAPKDHHGALDIAISKKEEDLKTAQMLRDVLETQHTQIKEAYDERRLEAARNSKQVVGDILEAAADIDTAFESIAESCARIEGQIDQLAILFPGFNLKTDLLSSAKFQAAVSAAGLAKRFGQSALPGKRYDTYCGALQSERLPQNVSEAAEVVRKEIKESKAA